MTRCYSMVDLFLCQWTQGFRQHFGCWEYCCYVCGCTQTCLNTCMLITRCGFATAFLAEFAGKIPLRILASLSVDRVIF